MGITLDTDGVEDHKKRDELRKGIDAMVIGAFVGCQLRIDTVDTDEKQSEVTTIFGLLKRFQTQTEGKDGKILQSVKLELEWSYEKDGDNWRPSTTDYTFSLDDVQNVRYPNQHLKFSTPDGRIFTFFPKNVQLLSKTFIAGIEKGARS